MSWPEIFRTLPPGTRVRATVDGLPHYAAGMEGIVCTHADDGCTLVAFDAPLLSQATKTKPADAWWATTETLEVLS